MVRHLFHFGSREDITNNNDELEVEFKGNSTANRLGK